MNEPLTAQDFVFYKENDQIMSGGYSVDSILLNQNRRVQRERQRTRSPRWRGVGEAE